MSHLQSKQRATIGHASRVTQCNIETIRYYEKIGLLSPPPRTTGGFRLYDHGHINRINFIRRARELGFHLIQIRELLHLVDNHNPTCEEVKKITLSHLDEVQQKIKDLKKLEKVLKDISSKCDEAEVPACPVIDALSAKPLAG